VSVIGQKTASAEAGLTSLFLFAKMGEWECLFSKAKKSKLKIPENFYEQRTC